MVHPMQQEKTHPAAGPRVRGEAPEQPKTAKRVSAKLGEGGAREALTRVRRGKKSGIRRPVRRGGSSRGEILSVMWKLKAEALYVEAEIEVVVNLTASASLAFIGWGCPEWNAS